MRFSELPRLDVSAQGTSTFSYAYPTPVTPFTPFSEFAAPASLPADPDPPIQSFATQPILTNFDTSLTNRTTPQTNGIPSQNTEDSCLPPSRNISNEQRDQASQPELYNIIHGQVGFDTVDDDIEEIPRSQVAFGSELVRLPSPPISEASFGAELLQTILLPQHLQLDQCSPELLMSRFNRDTCGILSIKDGQSENPWRTMIWPLAQNTGSSALYHAIHAMSAFHASKRDRSLQLEGVSHMQKSLHHLRSGIHNMNMGTETALATTLALAFCVSWDEHTSTGSEHLQGASALVEDAIVKYERTSLSEGESDCLRFLCNTWIYMDVLSRLTKMNGSGCSDYKRILTPLEGPADNDMDPLMGCASTLFPLIGRVADLVRDIQNTFSNSIKIISAATELKEALEGWKAPTSVKAPEDPDCAIQHGLQTAESYRWATLLYLHQAVPEIPSQSSADLARKVLTILATVPATSRAVIVHIYPLLAAGCEFTDQEERDWIKDRWDQMSGRMQIGNIDRCWEVTREVWLRRDEKFASRNEEEDFQRAMSRRSTGFTVPVEHLKRKYTSSRSSSDGSIADDASSQCRSRKIPRNARTDILNRGMIQPSNTESREVVEELDYGMTVRGRLHWLGVMKDWNWEGKDPRYALVITTDSSIVLLG